MHKLMSVEHLWSGTAGNLKVKVQVKVPVPITVTLPFVLFLNLRYKNLTLSA
jgi:hypothetical protein